MTISCLRSLVLIVYICITHKKNKIITDKKVNPDPYFGISLTTYTIQKELQNSQNRISSFKVPYRPFSNH